MILEKLHSKFNSYDSKTFIDIKKLLILLDKNQNFRDELIKLFELKEDSSEIIQIGNSKPLIDSLLLLNSKCEKIDITSKIKNIQLKKMLEEEKALFEIFKIEEIEIIKRNRSSDILEVETAYSAKHDILDYYNFSKFANYCRDLKYDDLIEVIKKFLSKHNSKNEEEKNLRILYHKSENKFYLRAITSLDSYRDYGINFSVFVALIALSRYSIKSKNKVFIDNYVVDDSTIYLSFNLSSEKFINKNLSLSFNLILENDEIKRNAVSFNGIFKLKYKDDGKSSEIYLKPHGMKKDNTSYPVDLLTYRHSGNINLVFEKHRELPDLINFFTKQVAKDTIRISKIKNTKDVRVHLANKIKGAKKTEFQKYKATVYNKLMKITVDNTFNLFEIFREVDELFENDDVISRDYWRTKLYESLIQRV